MSTQPRMRVGALLIGPEATFGAGSNSLTYYRAREISQPVGRKIEGGENLVQRDAQDRPSVLREPGDMEFTMDVYPAASDWPTGPASSDEARSATTELLGVMLGQQCIGELFATCGAGSTTRVIQLDPYGDTPADAGIVEGDPVWFRASGADRVLGFNTVQSIDNGNKRITLVSPLPSAPASGCEIYGSVYSALNDGFDLVSAQADVVGDKTYNRQSNKGVVLSNAVLSFPFRQLASIKYSAKVALPIPPTAAESGGSPAQQVWADGNGSQVIDGGIYLWDGTNNVKIEGGGELDFGVNVVERPGINGVDPNGIAGYDRENVNPVVKLQPNYLSNAFYTLADSETSNLVLTVWWGRGARVVGFQIPAVYFKKFPERTDRDGLVDLSIELGMLPYSGHSGTSTANNNVDKSLVVASLAPEASA